MDSGEIQLQQPDSDPQKSRGPESGGWHPVTWAIIGLALGTLIAAPLVLSSKPRTQFRGGAIFGGIPGALIGLAYGAKRRGWSRG